MTPLQVIFVLSSLLVLASAFLVVTARNLFHAALWLVATLFGVAIIFVLLEAGFLAVVQVVVYIGAIAILFIFAVMLTRRIMKDVGPQINSNWWLAALISAVFFAGMAWMLTSWQNATAEVTPLTSSDMVAELGRALVSPNAYVLPFELASVLLLAALIGAVVVAWDKK